MKDNTGKGDMDIGKGISLELFSKAVEVILWLGIIGVAIFLNLSPQIFNKTNPVLIIAFLIAFLGMILSRILPLMKKLSHRIALLAGFTFIALLPFLLISTSSAGTIMFYYLPAAIAVSMAFLVIMDLGMHVIILVGLSVFFLGETFFGIEITATGGLRYPMVFLRTFSLTLLAIFSYYLYAKETFIRRRLSVLNEQLKSLDRMKSDFVTNVSHELRTPLTSIRNAAVLIQRKLNRQEIGNSASEGELLDIVISNVDRQCRLIDGILDLAKIEGRQGISRSLVNIGRIAEEVVKSMTMQAAIKRIRIITDIQQNLPQIYASEDKMAEVYTNLLDNAIKYTKEDGRVILRISVAGEKIESSVEDTGAGIATEDLGKLFDKFSRLQTVREYENKGTGLGLIITKEIVELHGGKIWWRAA